MADDLARLTFDAIRHRHHARTHGRHLRPVVQRVDRAHQRTAEGRTGRGQRAVGVDIERRAVGGQAGQQRRRHGSGEVAAERGGAKQKDLRLVGVNDVRQRLGVGFVAVVGEQIVGDDIDQIGPVAERLGGRMPRCVALRPDHHSGEIDLQLVCKLAPGPEQLPGDGMDLATFLFDEYPDVLVGFEVLRQLLLGSRSSCRGRCFGGFAHQPCSPLVR
jgi:hypothetical protein